eukprot:scaffold20704_cov129-Isochrysis_galbana.AAC.1
MVWRVTCGPRTQKPRINITQIQIHPTTTPPLPLAIGQLGGIQFEANATTAMAVVVRLGLKSRSIEIVSDEPSSGV